MSNNRTIHPDVLAVLKQLTFNGTLATMPQLSKELYQKVNKVLELAGGKWSRKDKAHVFPEDAEEIIADAVATGAILNRKKAFQYFPTPDRICDRLVDMADITEGDSILEPSAGDGAIVRAIRRRFPANTVHAVELDGKHENKLRESGASSVNIENFLTAKLPKCDRVVANPPFRNGQDIAHVRRMFDILTKGGKLVAITSPSWTFRTNRAFVEFRDWLESANHSVTELPSGSFRESGTEIATLIIKVEN